MPGEPKAEEQAKAFIGAYEALCKEHGHVIVAEPVWKQSLDTGDWRLIIQLKVQRTKA